MPTPYSTRPKVTQLDISNGFVTRYFVQNISTKLITEVDKKQYEAFKTNVLYGRIDFPWVIMGLANDTLATDGNIIYGAKHKNTVTTAFYNKKMPGLTRLLSNPLEGFQGTRNPELVVPPSQPTYNSNIAGTGTGRTIDNFVFVPSVEPEVVIPTLVVSPTSINFAFTQSASLPSTQYVYITEVSGSSVSGLYITSQSNWFSASLSATTTPTTMSVAISSTQLAVTTFTSSIIVSSSTTQITSPITLPVTASVAPIIGPDYWWRADIGLTTSSWTAYNGGYNFTLSNVTTSSAETGVVFNGSTGFGLTQNISSDIAATHVLMRIDNLPAAPGTNDTILGGTQDIIAEIGTYFNQGGFLWYIVDDPSDASALRYAGRTGVNISSPSPAILWFNFESGSAPLVYTDNNDTIKATFSIYSGTYNNRFTWTSGSGIYLARRRGGAPVGYMSVTVKELAIFTSSKTYAEIDAFRDEMLARWP